MSSRQEPLRLLLGESALLARGAERFELLFEAQDVDVSEDAMLQTGGRCRRALLRLAVGV
jgi:hypothetical protein